MLKSPTRITNNTKTLIDIIITTREDRIENHIVIGNSISDHDLTGINRKMNCKKFKPRRIITRNYTKYDKEAYQIELTNSFSFLNDITNYPDANVTWDKFKSVLSLVIDKHAPLVERVIQGQDCPWLTMKSNPK